MASERVAEWHLENRAGESSFAAQAREITSALPPGPVLDLGCGTAPLLRYVEPARNPWYGVERDDAMARGGRRRDPTAPISRADAVRLPFPEGSFAAVVALGLFEYLEDPVVVLAEARRVTVDGGAVLVTVPRRDAPYRRGLGAAAPFLRASGRRDPFDLLSGRSLRPVDAARWARRAGLALSGARPVAAAVVPWPLDRFLPRAARSLAATASPAFGTAWLFRFTCPERGRRGEWRV
jgi:SAM-dependent methyltransferase